MNIKNITQIAVFTAVLSVLSPLTINLPVSPVPISIANFVIYIFAILLGTKKSIFGVLVYLLLGTIGLPVFSKGASGAGYLFGPTGGYLAGFLLCSLCTSLGYELSKKITENKFIQIIIVALGMVIGTVLCYLLGTIWLSFLNNLDFNAALAAGVIPFIPGDIAKIIIALIVATPIRQRVEKFM